MSPCTLHWSQVMRLKCSFRFLYYISQNEFVCKGFFFASKGLSLPEAVWLCSMTLALDGQTFKFNFAPLRRYMKYLYPYECEKRGLSNPNELQAAIDSNRREGRRQSFGSSLFTYSPNGTPTMLSSPKLSMPAMGIALPSNGASVSSLQKIKKGKTLMQWVMVT